MNLNLRNDSFLSLRAIVSTRIYDSGDMHYNINSNIVKMKLGTPEFIFVNILKSPGIDSRTGGQVR
jgi:hypothetical protein